MFLLNLKNYFIKGILSILPFCYSFIEEPVIKPFSDKKSPLNEPWFYNSFLGESNITKYSKAFKNHLHSYMEVLHSQDSESQFNIAKPNFKNYWNKKNLLPL